MNRKNNILKLKKSLLIIGGLSLLCGCGKIDMSTDFSNNNDANMDESTPTKQIYIENPIGNWSDNDFGIQIEQMTTKMDVMSLSYSDITIDGIFIDSANNNLICSIDCWDKDRSKHNCLLVYVFSLTSGECLSEIEYPTELPIFFTDACLVGSNIFENIGNHDSIPIKVDTLKGEVCICEKEYRYVKNMENANDTLMCFYPITQNGNEEVYIAGYGNISLNDEITTKRAFIFEAGEFKESYPVN